MTSPGTSTPAPARKPRLLFVVTEDWFFWSHFQPMARAALADGFDVAVACRVRDHAAQITSLGCRLLPLEADRRTLNPFAILRTISGMHDLIQDDDPDIVHLIALRSIVIGGLAARLAGVSRRVVALTGMGLLGAASTLRLKVARLAVRAFIRLVVDDDETRFLFENQSDPGLLGLDAEDRAKVTIVGGAGIDPEVFRPEPLPPNPPLKLAMIARMLWSKGADTAVAAVLQARNAGADVTLSLYGAPDPGNPKAIPEATLRTWDAMPGIRWHGRIDQDEVPAIWAEHHAAVLPSRGGEGLPRTLLEAAGCGRAILTTDVPGCRDLVRGGVEGLLVPPDDPEALTRAILAMAAEPHWIDHMGAAARARILIGFTETTVGRAVVHLYRSMLA
ncbi:MAG: glycosyltransferase family 4 protein [Methylocystis sp.]|nr:glycosyltransferase family 4 protein [Methylocystis sp.]MCA3589818.1 glycosyltransferase family 4 protein [Methylocystis sp.]MCA3591583.1 glycosyltransferase family 4 protein [Methylocystis sp.]